MLSERYEQATKEERERREQDHEAHNAVTLAAARKAEAENTKLHKLCKPYEPLPWPKAAGRR